MKTMETILNHELKLCTEWLKTNRLSLNADKSKFIIFKSKEALCVCVCCVCVCVCVYICVCVFMITEIFL